MNTVKNCAVIIASAAIAVVEYSHVLQPVMKAARSPKAVRTKMTGPPDRENMLARLAKLNPIGMLNIANPIHNQMLE
jgi:hypothetical protein